MPQEKQQLDLLVVGLGRSGTTLLTHLLTNPEQGRLCLAEPRLTTRRAYRPEKQDYFRTLGVQGQVNTRTVAEHLFSQQRIGLKEIRSHHIKNAIKRYDPKHIVLITRDLRAALASYNERHAKRADSLPKSRRRFPAKLFLRTAPLMLRLLETEKHRVTVTQYERFVSDEAERNRLAELLDWPLDGNLGFYAATGRDNERKKHDGQISTKSLTRPLPTDPETLAVLKPVFERLAPYQRAFGYPVDWDAPPTTEPAPLRAEVTTTIKQTAHA